MERDEFSSQLPMSPEEVAKSIEGGLPGLDASRAGGLAQVGQLRDAKARSLSREQRLLALKHRGTAHPRIAEAQQRFTVNELFRREIAVVREQAETPVPEPGKDTMIVHGFVRRRSDHAGLPGLTLALTDDEGNWIREFGYACTDQRGYFRLDITGRGSEEPTGGGGDKIPDIKPPAGISVEDARREAEVKAAATGRSEADTTATAPRRGLQLRVFDSKGQSLHTESRPVVLRAGTVDYRLILLGDEAARSACTPPPAKTGGRPVPAGPRPPSGAPPPVNVPSRDVPPAAEPRASTLKSYAQPPPPTGPVRPVSPAGTPLEAIRGIGPKRAEKLRQAGIADVEQYEQTPGAEFVKIAGFDKTRPKTPRTEPKPVEPAPGTKAAAQAKPAEPAPETRSLEPVKPAEPVRAKRTVQRKAAARTTTPKRRKKGK